MAVLTTLTCEYAARKASELNNLSVTSEQATYTTREILIPGFQEGMSSIKIASQAIKDDSGQSSHRGQGSQPLTPRFNTGLTIVTKSKNKNI